MSPHDNLKRAYRASLTYVDLKAAFETALRRHDSYPTSGAVAALAFRDALESHLAINCKASGHPSTRAGMAMIEALKGTIGPARIAEAGAPTEAA